MNLIFHYQNIIHGINALVLHEAFSTRAGELYSVNPTPVEVAGESEQEIEENLRAMELDSTTYKPVRLAKIQKQLARWVDEVIIPQDIVVPEYEDEEELEDDYYSPSGEVLDLCEYFERRR